MDTKLFIAEKPSVAKAIGAELGIANRADGYFTCRDGSLITWCFGHLLEQAEPDDYLPDDIPKTKKGRKIWRLQDLPIIPTAWLSHARTDRGVKKQLTTIGKLLKQPNVTVVVNAGDPDREGQLLVDEVLEHFKCRKPVKRFWVSAVDPASIRKGLKTLKENVDYAGMRDAARGRSRADWLLGMNLSRAYTLTNDGGLIAVGRVQTPTLAMVARRDYAVRNFVPQPYLSISADLEAKDCRFRAKWKPREGQPGMDEEGKLLIDLELGRLLVEKLKQEKTATVTSSVTKRKKAFQPKAYSLADIQIEASRMFGMSAEETLKVCQSLYEVHKITSYPRTDCGYLPESQHADAPAVLAAIAKTFPATQKAVERADPTIKSPTFNDKKVTAHHGIVPVANTASWDKLSPAEQKLYRLIARRYIANFFPVHEYDATEIRFDLGGETFVATGKVVVVQGWKVLFEKTEAEKAAEKAAAAAKKSKAAAKKADGEADDDDESDQALPTLVKGDVANVLDVIGREDQTKPPSYFTEGTLIAAMENVWRSFDDPHLQEKLKEAGGIGTPATRASIIQELKRKKYLETEKKFLHCTEEGRNVLLVASPKVRSAAMTAAFETKLSQIERGEYGLDQFVAEYEAFICEEIGRTKSAPPVVTGGGGAAGSAGSAGGRSSRAGGWRSSGTRSRSAGTGSGSSSGTATRTRSAGKTSSRTSTSTSTRSRSTTASRSAGTVKKPQWRAAPEGAPQAPAVASMPVGEPLPPVEDFGLDSGDLPPMPPAPPWPEDWG